MVLVAYRHGLRAAELVDLRCGSGLTSERPPCTSAGSPSTHPILWDELRALRRLHREQEPKSPFVFTSERGAPFTTAGFARMIERAVIQHTVRLTELRRQSIVTAFRPKRPIYAAAKTCV